MCIINTTHAFVFVHVPKTAGTSVCQVLSKHCGALDLEIGGSAFGESIQTPYLRRHGLRKHSTALEIKASIGAARWRSMTSFAVLRDPVERLASAYRFLKQWDSPLNSARSQMRSLASFRAFVESGFWEDSEGLDQIFRPQASWVLDLDGEILVDRLIAMSNIKSELLRVLLEAAPQVDWRSSIERMPHLNPSNPEPIDLEDHLIERLVRRYEADYRLLSELT